MGKTIAIYAKKAMCKEKGPGYIFFADRQSGIETPMILGTYTPEKTAGGIDLIQFIPELALLITPFIDHCFRYKPDANKRKAKLNEYNMPLNLNTGLALAKEYQQLIKSGCYAFQERPVFEETQLLKDFAEGKQIPIVVVDFNIETEPKNSELVSLLGSDEDKRRDVRKSGRPPPDIQPCRKPHKQAEHDDEFFNTFGDKSLIGDD